jgi:hypothetical protein
MSQVNAQTGSRFDQTGIQALRKTQSGRDLIKQFNESDKTDVVPLSQISAPKLRGCDAANRNTSLIKLSHILNTLKYENKTSSERTKSLVSSLASLNNEIKWPANVLLPPLNIDIETTPKKPFPQLNNKSIDLTRMSIPELVSLEDARIFHRKKIITIIETEIQSINILPPPAIIISKNQSKVQQFIDVGKTSLYDDKQSAEKHLLTIDTALSFISSNSRTKLGEILVYPVRMRIRQFVSIVL